MTASRRPTGLAVRLAVALLALVLAGCGGSTSEGQTDEPSSASTASSSNGTSGEADEQDETPEEDETTSAEKERTSAEEDSSDLTERLLAAELPLDVLGLERSTDLDPRVELVDDHFLVCPQEDAEVTNVAQSDVLLAGSIIREFLIFDDEAAAMAFLDSVEAANVGGCESVLEREDGPSRSATVQSFEAITIDGAKGFRWVAVQQIDMPDRAPSNVIRVQAREANIVVVATIFTGFIEEEPNLEELVRDGLDLVRSAP